MADNTVLSAAVGTGDTIATDDVAGVKHQLVKVEFGALDTATLVTSTVGLPTDTLDRAARDCGKVDVALIDQYTPIDVDSGAGTVTAFPVALQVSGAGGVTITGDVANGLDVDVTRVGGTVTVAGTVMSNQGTPGTTANRWPIQITDGTDLALVSAAGALAVDGSGVTQPVSGTITANAGTGSFTVAQATAASLNMTEASAASILTSAQKTDNIAHTGSDVALSDHVPVSGQFDDTATTTVTENNIAPIRITSTRAMHVSVRDALPAGTANIGDVDVLTLPSLVAGTANIGDVDVLTLPALATGSNVIGSLVANQSVNVAQMNGVAVTMGNGISGTGVQRVTLASDSTGQVTLASGATTAVTQATASNLNAQVVGVAAHDAPVSGNPHRVAGKANANEPTAVADGDLCDMWVNQYGAQVVVKNFPANLVSATHGPTTTTLTLTSDTALVAAPGVGLSIYVTSLTVGNTSATLTRIDIKDGTTIRVSMPLASSGGGFVHEFNPPWKLTANTALNAALSAAVTDVRANVHFYVAA